LRLVADPGAVTVNRDPGCTQHDPRTAADQIAGRRNADEQQNRGGKHNHDHIEVAKQGHITHRDR